MKKFLRIICIIFIVLILVTLFSQLAAFNAAPLLKESSGISSHSDSIVFVERSFFTVFTGSLSLRSVFIYILYLAIFTVTIRFSYKQRYFIRRLTLQQIRIFHKTTNERESDA